MSRSLSAIHAANDGLPSDPPLRLLFVGNVDSIHVRRWAGFFAARGHDVHAAGLWGPTAEDADAPFEVHRLGRPKTAFLGLRHLAQHLRSQVVHAHYLTYYGWIARAALIDPYAVTLWGSDVLIDLPASRLRRTWARLVLHGAACVTADSEEIVNTAVRLGANPSRTHQIQFGVDTSRFSPGPPPVELLAHLGLAGRRMIFSPRSIAPLYRTLVAVHALHGLPEDVVLVGSLAGADPAYADLVTSTAAEWGLGDQIRLLPAIPHDEIAGYYRASNVVLSIPASDGTPVSVLEALATGTPVVATDLPAVRPWLGSCGARFLVAVDDVAATRAALLRALDMSAEERLLCAADGRAVVVQRGDYSLNMLRVEAIYRELAHS